MFYQRLTLPIHELENKRQLKCTFMSIDQKEEKEVTLYPNKGSKVEQMLDEAKQVMEMEILFMSLDHQLNSLQTLLLKRLFIIYFLAYFARCIWYWLRTIEAGRYYFSQDLLCK